MKKVVLSFLACCAVLPLARAGEPQTPTAVAVPTVGTDAAGVPIDIFFSEEAYTFESDVTHAGGTFGQQDSLQTNLEYAHRFRISGNFYFHLGLAYERFDFGRTDAPLPVHLQAGAGVIGIDYMQGPDVGAFLEFRPGFYTEDKIGINSFDCPITVARFWTLSQDKLYLLTGVTVGFLRGQYPVFPLVGVVWKPCPQWRVLLIPPDPKIIYSPSKALDVWLGGQFTGGSFRTDNQQDFKYRRLNGAEVDYLDYRAGVGFTYSPTPRVALDVSGGYSLQRQFNFDRANTEFRSDPAPYLRLAFKAQF